MLRGAATVAGTLLRLQRTVGNAAVRRAVAGAPRADGLAAISDRADRPPAEVTSARAGATEGAAPPGGLAGILARSSGGFTGGWTGVRSSGAFTAPTVTTRNVVERLEVPGRAYPLTRHYAVLQPTAPADATHESWYPQPGIHHVPRLRRRYRISEETSRLIRRGEQEHLDDARRAYDLTYGAVGEVVNRLAQRGTRFGPADSPAEAERLALARLEQLLGPLTATPSRWPTLLDRLLAMTQRRDDRGWHYLETQPGTHRGGRVHDVVPGPTTRIGVPSEQVVDAPR